MIPGLANVLVLEPGLGPKARVYLDGQEAEAWAPPPPTSISLWTHQIRPLLPDMTRAQQYDSWKLGEQSLN